MGAQDLPFPKPPRPKSKPSVPPQEKPQITTLTPDGTMVEEKEPSEVFPGAGKCTRRGQI